MHRKHRKLSLVVLFSLVSWVSCATTRTKGTVAGKDAPTASDVFLYHANVASAPPGASSLVLHVRLPAAGPAASAKLVEAYGLVGNAPFDFRSLSLDDTQGLASGPAKLSMRGEQGDVRELWVETAGKPVEFSLRLAVPAGTAIEASALEQELVHGTSAVADGRTLEALVTHLQRVR